MSQTEMQAELLIGGFDLLRKSETHHQATRFDDGQDREHTPAKKPLMFFCPFFLLVRITFREIPSPSTPSKPRNGVSPAPSLSFVHFGLRSGGRPPKDPTTRK